MKYRKSSFAYTLSFLILFALIPGLSAQHAHLMKEKNSDDYYPVARVSGFAPFLLKDGKARKSRNVESVKLVETYEYAPGYLVVGKFDARLNYYEDVKDFKELELSFPVYPSQDYKNNYAVIKLYTVSGGSYFVTAELPSLKAEKVKIVHLIIRVVYEVDEGHFQMYYFSGDKEIYHVTTDVNIRSKKPDKIRSLARTDTAPELRNLGSPGMFMFEANFPQGEDKVKATFSVNDKGGSFNHKILETSNNDLSRWVIKSLKKSSFGPGSKDGYYEEMPLTMEFTFRAGRLIDAAPVAP